MRYAIAIDIGGTTIKYALVNSNYEFLFTNSLPSLAQETTEAVINQVFKAVSESLEFANDKNLKIDGVGIGSPGIIDENNRIILGGADNIVGWKDIALADIIENKFNLPTKLDNDANVMALGEFAKGAAQGYSNVIFLTVGTGIGGALFINGKIFNGYQNKGGELGHIALFSDGEACNCGSVGCLEQYASTGALVRRFIKRSDELDIKYNDEVNGEFIVKLFKNNDPIAIETINEHCYFLGRGLAGLINVFSPQQIVIGGGISEAGDFYIDRIRKAALKHAMPDCSVNTKLAAASLGNKASFVGAASLIFEQ